MAYFDPKKAKRNARRQAEQAKQAKQQNLGDILFPSRTKPSIRFCANNMALFYDPQSEVSFIVLNTPALAEKFKFANAERMTRTQAHGVVGLIDDIPAEAKKPYHEIIDAPTDAETDAKNNNLK